MTRARFENARPAALALGFALSLPLAAVAQPGPGLSSGSGSGTGTGTSSAIGQNRSGSVSGVGPGTPFGGGGFGPGGLGGAMPPAPSGFSVPMGPGVDVTFPDDTSLFPFGVVAESAPGAAATATRVATSELEFARTIADPGDRSLTLQRIANVAIFSNQLDLAHRALNDAAPAALAVTDPVTHDLRLIALVTALNNLAEAHLREGKAELTAAEIPPDPTAPLPKQQPVEHATLISRAGLEWRRAAHLAERIANPTYRSEMLYRVIDSQAYGSQTVLNEFPRPAETPSNNPDAPRPSSALEKNADDLLVSAASMAQRIARPVWRDRALVAIASSAGQSRQFARGLQVARMIPQPEVRTDALVKIAEAQARPAGNDPEGATATYQEAAQAVASIPLDDPRAVLAGVLIDNLISVGRFEDARRMIVLYPDTSRRLIALGAIAESQGFRGASESAVEWIKREVSEQYRPFLYRRLRFGMLAAIEQNRSRDLSNRER